MFCFSSTENRRCQNQSPRVLWRRRCLRMVSLASWTWRSQSVLSVGPRGEGLGFGRAPCGLTWPPGSLLLELRFPKPRVASSSLAGGTYVLPAYRPLRHRHAYPPDPRKGRLTPTVTPTQVYFGGTGWTRWRVMASRVGTSSPMPDTSQAENLNDK